MAPRRGGYSSGGGSACPLCDVPLTLNGYNWKLPTTTALFAMYIILMLILIACMVLKRRFKWIRERETDKLRNSGYLVAAVCTFISYFISALYLALAESETTVTYSMFIGYIFQEFFGRVGSVLIIAIIARTITEDVGATVQKVASFGVGILWALTTISFGFFVAYYSEYLALGHPDYIVVSGTAYTSIVELSYTLALVIFLSVLAVLAVLKRRSTATFLMLLAVMTSLFLMSLLQLVRTVVFNFTYIDRTKQAYDLLYANIYISVIATMIIFLTVALIAGLRQRHPDASGMTQVQKLAQAGPNYVAVDPYSAPDPYNPQGIPATGQQPFQYAPQQYPQHGQQPVQYAAPVPVSPAPYGAPTSSSVSPPPQNDQYQLHMQQQQQLHQ